MNWPRVFTVSGTVLLIGGLVYALTPILMPFAVSFIFAYIGNPVVGRIEQFGLPRTVAVISVFTLFVLICVVAAFSLVPALHQQINSFAGKIPGYMDWMIATAIPWLQQTFGLDFSAVDIDSAKKALVGHWRDVGGWLGGTMFQVSRTGLNLLAWMANIILIPVISFYLLRDWQALLSRIDNLLSPAARPQIRQLALESDQVLSSLMRGQLSVMAALTVVYCIGLSILGLDLALPIGLLAGAVSFVPYLGFVIGAFSAGLAVLLQYHDVTMLLWVFIVFFIGQILEGFILTPWLVGDRLGLHPVAIIFSVMAGGQLFGFVGVLLALPAAAMLVVMLRHVHTTYAEPRESRRTRKKTFRKKKTRSRVSQSA